MSLQGKSESPTWYQEPNEQIVKLRDLLMNANVYDELKGEFETVASKIPDIIPTSPTQILILAFYLDDKDGIAGLERTMRILWDAADEPKQVGGYSNPEEKADWFASNYLRLTPRYIWEFGVRWIFYDYNSYNRYAPADALKDANKNGVNLATIEPLLISTINQEYVNSYGRHVFLDYSNSSLPPCMSGLQSFLPSTIAREPRHTPILDSYKKDGNYGIAFRIAYSCRNGYVSGCSPTIENLHLL
jgi:hypothetical protein